MGDGMGDGMGDLPGLERDGRGSSSTTTLTTGLGLTAAVTLVLAVAMARRVRGLKTALRIMRRRRNGNEPFPSFQPPSFTAPLEQSAVNHTVVAAGQAIEMHTVMPTAVHALLNELPPPVYTEAVGESRAVAGDHVEEDVEEDAAERGILHTHVVHTHVEEDAAGRGAQVYPVGEAVAMVAMPKAFSQATALAFGEATALAFGERPCERSRLERDDQVSPMHAHGMAHVSPMQSGHASERGRL